MYTIICILLDEAPIHQKYENEKEDLRILIILPGLTGGSGSNYITQAALNGYRFGFRTICVNTRGVDQPMLVKTQGNSNWSDYSKIDDLELAIEHIRSKYPKARLYALGISIGANSLIKYAAAKGDNCPLRGIACIANPWNINSNFAELKKFSNRIYDFALAGRFVRNFKANIEQFKNLPTIDANKIIKSTSVEEFENQFTQKIFNIQNMSDYYDKISSYKDVPNVKVPVLAIQSKDDPVCREYIIPKEELQKNPNFILVLTERGGHIEYFTGYTAVRWVYWPCMEYLAYIDTREDQKEMESGYDKKALPSQPKINVQQ